MKKGTAVLLLAACFIKTAATMNFYDKQCFLERYTSLNRQANTNVLHVSLNFDPAEKLDNENMAVIVSEYMERIGFEEQPFLVYRHRDAGHPNLHIVSSNIKSTSERISMHRLSGNQSEKARWSVGIDFNLVKAESKTQQAKLIPVNVI